MDGSTDWDNAPITYDADAYDFTGWVKGALRDAGIEPPDDLSLLHEVAPPEVLTQTFLALPKKAGSDDAFCERYYAFVDEVIAPLFDTQIAVQRYPNFRPLLPARPEMCIPFHTDAWYGHGPDERNCWLPLCGATSTASLQVIDLEEVWLEASVYSLIL